MAKPVETDDSSLTGALAGALAAGGDPATSPLYVFGPFLRLVVPAGVAAVTFGPSIWLAVLTVATVSTMYRFVMQWVTDGTGGTGLSEDEFGPWAAKLNAAITFIEYSLTYLVSISALVTFVADRLPAIGGHFAGLEMRAIVALGLTVAIAAVVVRGPRASAFVFGPATAGVLMLLWLMNGAVLLRFGLVLPTFSWAAFGPEYIGFTLGGYARILALMTGIEVFANLVPAYSGSPAKKSRKAFGSLVIIMGTTVSSMVILGPAILALSDPSLTEVSVFTQTLDALVPTPVAYLGTLVAVAVLISACATALQGVAHLAHGLGHRHYVPERLGEANSTGMADRAVWLHAASLGLCILVVGTHEETYLALYAAGVFILLSMTGWAAAARLRRRSRAADGDFSMVLQLATVVVAAAMTSVATGLIFFERFTEGAWLYAVLIPVFYAAMTRVRTRRGEPTPAEDELGRKLACDCLGRCVSECACNCAEGR